MDIRPNTFVAPGVVGSGQAIEGPVRSFPRSIGRAEAECLRLIAECRECTEEVAASPSSSVESLYGVLASWDKRYQASTLSACPNKWVLRSQLINEHFTLLVRKLQERRAVHEAMARHEAAAATRKKEAAEKQEREAHATEQRKHNAKATSFWPKTRSQWAVTPEAATKRAREAKAEPLVWALEPEAMAEHARESKAAAKQAREAEAAADRARQAGADRRLLEAEAMTKRAADVAAMSEGYSEMQSSLIELQVPGDLPKVNILLYGAAGARKISLIASVDSLISRTAVDVRGDRINNYYKRLLKFSFKLNPPQGSAKEAPFALWECWTEEREYEDGEMGYILDGNVPHGLGLSTCKPIHPQSRDFLAHPTLADEVHCVCFVVPSCSASDKEYITPLKQMKKVAMDLGIPTLVFLTEVDDFDPELRSNGLSSVFSSARIASIMMEVATLCSSGATKDVFPMKSFSNEYEPTADGSILLMSGVQHALHAAQVYLEDVCAIPSSGAAGKPATPPATSTTPQPPPATTSQGPVPSFPGQEQPAEQPTNDNSAVWECIGLIAKCQERIAQALDHPSTTSSQFQAVWASAAAVIRAVEAEAAKRARESKVAAQKVHKAEAAADRAQQAESDRQRLEAGAAAKRSADKAAAAQCARDIDVPAVKAARIAAQQATAVLDAQRAADDSVAAEKAAGKAAMRIAMQQATAVLDANRAARDSVGAKAAARRAQEAKAAANAALEVEAAAAREREAEAHRRVQELALQAEHYRQAAEQEKRERAALERRMNAMDCFSELLAGGELREGQSMTSPDGKSKFAFQDDGNLVVYRDGAAIWATNTSAACPKPAKLVVQDDGNLVVYGIDGRFAGWASNTDTLGDSQTRLVLQNGGILILRHSSGRALWTSAEQSLLPRWMASLLP